MDPLPSTVSVPDSDPVARFQTILKDKPELVPVAAVVHPEVKFGIVELLDII